MTKTLADYFKIASRLPKDKQDLVSEEIKIVFDSLGISGANSKNSNRRKETKEALKNFENGETVEGEKVLRWLSSWGKKNELSKPV